MPETTRGVWGIDIGQAGLKAIRLRYAEAAQQVLAVAFDYVPHAKILSQPDAVPDELIGQAIQTFLSRNDLKGDVVCISVPGQSALARFIQLPPVERSKVADIVKYEAKQQIPFALEDVIWDFQTLGVGLEEGGFLLDAEVGLFAMKREQVMQQLRPYMNSKVEVELVQIAPLALYNYLTYDRLGIRQGSDTPPPDEYTILLDMGADNTMLLVSNGTKIWIRNVPIGGNHFTRALTKEMKLTFAKAEHLKCTATKSADPKAVFQALRPVFNDYVAEIQRSIGYFSSVNRDAKIARVLGMGNGFKLAGLQKFLQQNLQYEVEKLDNFQGLVGDTVLHAPLFEENLMSFAVPYGLALQGIGLTKIHTTLLPQEIATARKIRRKKPWAAVTAASLLFGLASSAVGYGTVYKSVSKDRFGAAEEKVKTLQGEISTLKGKYSAAEGENKKILDQGALLVSTLDTREQWMEVYKAINESLPRDTQDKLDETDPAKKNRIKLTSITSKKLPDVSTWYNALPQAAKDRLMDGDKAAAPTGAGYLFTLEGVHYHDDKNNPRTGQGVLYVIHTLLKNLHSWTVLNEGSAEPVPVRKLGISHATIIASRIEPTRVSTDGGRQRASVSGSGAGQGYSSPAGLPPTSAGAGRPRTSPMPNFTTPGANAGGANSGDSPAEFKDVNRTTFTLQFLWTPTPVEKRKELSPEAEKAAAEAAANPNAANPNASTPGATPSATTPPATTPPATTPPATTPPATVPPSSTAPNTTPPGAATPNTTTPGATPPDPAAPPAATPTTPAGSPPATATPGAAATPPASTPGTPAGAPPGATPPATTPPAKSPPRLGK